MTCDILITFDSLFLAIYSTSHIRHPTLVPASLFVYIRKEVDVTAQLGRHLSRSLFVLEPWLRRAAACEFVMTS